MLKKSNIIIKSIQTIFFASFMTSLIHAANFDTKCAVAAYNAHNSANEDSLGCTAKDADLGNFRITWVGDGCINGNDTALVKMAVTVYGPNADANNMGIYINTAGGASAEGSNTAYWDSACLHEAFFPVDNNNIDLLGGTGPFPEYDGGGDICGDIPAQADVERNITVGTSQDTAIFEVACYDNDNDGYVDFAWTIAWDDTSSACTEISDTVAWTKSKCRNGIGSSLNYPGSTPIGIPDLDINITCTPEEILEGETTHCTAVYTNACDAGPADNIEFHIAYPVDKGYVSNFTLTESDVAGSIGADAVTDDGNGTINWQIDANATGTPTNPPLHNIGPCETATLEFDFTLIDAQGEPLHDKVVTTWFNGPDGPVEQDLNDTTPVATYSLKKQCPNIWPDYTYLSASDKNGDNGYDFVDWNSGGISNLYNSDSFIGFVDSGKGELWCPDKTGGADYCDPTDTTRVTIAPKVPDVDGAHTLPSTIDIDTVLNAGEIYVAPNGTILEAGIDISVSGFVNTPAFIYIDGDVTIKGGVTANCTDVNTYGDPNKLVIYINGSAQYEEGSCAAGFLYAKSKVELKGEDGNGDGGVYAGAYSGQEFSPLGPKADIYPVTLTADMGDICENPNLPVTVSHISSTLGSVGLEVNFGTASETGNIGFNIYGVKGKRWVKLNDELIPGALDSFEPQEYSASVRIPEGTELHKIGIAGVNVSGTEDRYGPYKIGELSGEKSVSIPVDWKKVRSEVNTEKKERKAKAKKAKKVTKELLKDQMVTFNVDKRAIYRVTHQELVARGIDLSGYQADTIAVSLKEEGTARHISNVGKNGKWTAGSTIEFIGERPNSKDALYVKSNHYRLSLDKKLVVESEAIDPLTNQEIVIDNNKKYAYTLNSDDPFYEAFFYTFNASQKRNYTSIFDMPYIPQSDNVKLAIKSIVTTEGSHHMSLKLNGVTIADSTKEGSGTWLIETDVESRILKQSDNQLTLTFYGENDGLDIVVYDKLTISYETDEAISSQTPQIVLQNIITPKELRVKQGINYLIISHPLFMNEILDRYIQTREGEGWNIKVVNVEEIYAAYSNGMVIPEAIKMYLNDSIQNGVTHVQLIGAASFDYHDYFKTGSLNLIPSIYTLTNGYAYYTPCDSCYVMGDDSLPNAAIGRWPVRTLEEFDNVINKTLAWATSGQGANRSALLIADEIDANGINFANQSDRLARYMNTNGWSDVEKVYLDKMKSDYGTDAINVARANIQNQLEQGPTILSYNGHGSTNTWSFRGLFQQNDISTINNNEATPIALPYTCMATYADAPRSSTMAHQLLAAGQNGAVAIYGASTFSNYGENGVMIDKVFKGLIQGQTLGEAILNKKRELGSSYQDVIRSGNLLGDVSLGFK